MSKKLNDFTNVPNYAHLVFRIKPKEIIEKMKNYTFREDKFGYKMKDVDTDFALCTCHGGRGLHYLTRGFGPASSKAM